MTYLTELENENAVESYLAILSPRRKISSFSLVSGFIYKASFSSVFGKPTRLEFNGVEMTEIDNPTTDASEWYFDETNREVYFREPNSGDPDVAGVTVIYYNLYVSTRDHYWYLNPLDSSTEIVYFEPLIQREPEIKSSTTDNIFGFLPLQNSSISLINSESFFEPHIYDSSFNSASIKVYHAIGKELSIANISLIYDGFMGDISYDTNKIVIKTLDRADIFSNEWRNSNTSFFSSTDFPNINPSFIGKPIRYVYGYVRGFQPVNIDFVQDSPTTSDNRNWVVVGEQTGLSDISRTVPATPSSTTTRTYVNFAEGISIGDTVFLDGATDYYVIVTNVNYTGDAYIEHAANAAPMATGEFVKKSFVSRVEITQNDIVYVAYYGRDYTTSNFAVGTRGFVFSSSLESNISLPNTLSSSDKVSCYVYGRENDLTASGHAFGTNDILGAQRTNNIANGVMVIYDILKNKIGLSESAINLTDFASIFTSTASSQALGIAIPSTAESAFPSYKDIITDILQSCLFKIFVDSSNKWTLKELEPVGSSDISIDDTEIMQFSYDFEYVDIVSDVIVEYLKREVPDQPFLFGDQVQSVAVSSANAMYLHKVNKQKIFRSLHFKAADALQFANHLSFVLGERRGTVKISTKKRFFNNIINDVVSVSREKLPGYVFTNGVENSVNTSIIEIQKSLGTVNLTADDQLGIETNSGSW